MRKIIYTLMGILAVFGIISLIIRFLQGMKVSSLSSSIPWGMWVVFYIYFVGLSSGSFLISTLVYVFGMKKLERIGPLSLFCALISLIMGLVFIWIDLGHPFRFWKVIFNWNYTSVLAWEVLFYSLFLLVLLVCLWLLKRCELSSQIENTADFRKILARVLSLGYRCPQTTEEYLTCHNRSLKLVKYLGIIGIPVVILVRGGTGALFAVIIARPHWFGGLLPILFLVSGLLSAVAMLLFIYPVFLEKKSDREDLGVLLILRNLLLFFLSLKLLLFISEILTGLYSKVPERLEVLHKVMFGPFPYIFWAGQLFLGMAIPYFLCSYKKTKDKPLWLSLAGFSCSCGVVSIILNLIIPAYVVPLLKGLDTAFIDKRLSYFYFPSLIEWFLSFGLISLFSLIFIFLLKNLPIMRSFGEEK